eukprot:TRINITY_DN7760_c0_g1_i1.p1 TRINITY_DN7760_c0_g1~~TRINITY_DN7760_c0_g1_i1.p1  ORF type:complete len:306 (+),score=44.48 TRINITY_DN7760_c0_g1_i1:137-1054(+)
MDNQQACITLTNTALKSQIEPQDLGMLDVDLMQRAGFSTHWTSRFVPLTMESVSCSGSEFGEDIPTAEHKPETPRAGSCWQGDQGTPPCTPRQRRPEATSPPPPPKPERREVSPLLAALKGGDSEVVRSLLEAQPSILRAPSFDAYNEFPLCWAIRSRRSPEIVQLLIDYGADINERDASGATPIKLLVKRTHNTDNSFAFSSGRFGQAATDEDRAIKAMLLRAGATDPVDLSMPCAERPPWGFTSALTREHLALLLAQQAAPFNPELADDIDAHRAMEAHVARLADYFKPYINPADDRSRSKGA